MQKKWPETAHLRILSNGRISPPYRSAYLELLNYAYPGTLAFTRHATHAERCVTTCHPTFRYPKPLACSSATVATPDGTKPGMQRFCSPHLSLFDSENISQIKAPARCVITNAATHHMLGRQLACVVALIPFHLHRTGNHNPGLDLPVARRPQIARQ